MTRPYLYIISLVILSVVAVAQKQKESCTPAIPIEIDAKVDEWQAEWLLDPEGKFLYNICNDETALFVRIKVSDITTQRKIALFGLTLWLDPSGKKKGKLGMKYPVGTPDLSVNPDNLNTMNRNPKRGDIEKGLLTDIEVLELIGLAKENIISSRLGLMNGIKVLIAPTEDGSYMYEAKLPFKAFRINKADVSILGIGFETGKLIPEKGKSQPASNGGPSSIPSYGKMSPFYEQLMIGPSGSGYEMTISTKMWSSVKLN